MGADKDPADTFSFRPFENLKEAITKKGLRISSGRAVKADPRSDEELFAAAMREVHEIDEFRRLPVRSNKTATVRKDVPSRRENAGALRDVVEGRSPLNLRNTQEYVEWINPSVKPGPVNAFIDALHKGGFSIQDFLDLHGFILDEAENEVGKFLESSLKMGYRCVKIIHGRGLRSPNGPVLKTALTRWLSGRYRKNVAAFVTARQCDGGLGAIYVLLK